MITPEKAGGGRKPGTWAPGQSGNPAGKKPGLASATALRQRLADEMDGIVKTLIKAAKGGDIAACRLLLERVLPALKPVELPQAIPMPVDAGLVGMGERVMLAVGEGSIAPGQASVLLAALASLSKIRETEELEQRIAALEERAGS